MGHNDTKEDEEDMVIFTDADTTNIAIANNHRK